jgi:5-methyltetrahydropteroyltriglutamate--homocysteine methyltransferase
VLDTSAMLGAVPAATAGPAAGRTRHLFRHGARAQGDGEAMKAAPMATHGGDVPAQEMTKWFDTNYHYLVPELRAGRRFALSSTKAVDEFLEAKALGYHTRPVLLGPVTWLTLAKAKDGVDPLRCFEAAAGL